MKPNIIFTDLDGTLLGHSDYGFEAASRGLQQISKLSIPLVLNSSKTMVEILDFRRQIKNHHPFIVENGAAVFIPEDYFPGYHEPYTPHLMGKDRVSILAAIHKLRKQYDFKFEGFHDFSVSELQELTGLREMQAECAKQRIGSEPIKWYDTESRLELFKTEIKKFDLRLLQGGRFYHVMGLTDKAKAMQWLLEKYRQRYEKDWNVLALGDSENDKAMLEQADLAVVIRKPDGEHLQLANQQFVIYSEHVAPLGWQESVSQVFGV